MAIDSINSVLAQMRAINEVHNRGTAAVEPPRQEVAFGAQLQKAVAEVNALQQTSAELKVAFEQDQPGISLPQVMIASQKASLSFEAMTQVRNKVLGAYQEIMNMQV